MKAELQLLLEAEEEAGSPIGAYLRPGLSAPAIRARFADIGLVAPDELVELYAWRDGTDQKAWQAAGHEWVLELLPHARFSPVDAAISDYRELRAAWQQTPQFKAYLAGDDPGYGYWRSEWFPVLESDRWRHAVDCSKPGESPVWHVYLEPSPPTGVKYVSLTDLVQTVTDLFKSRACSWDSSEDGLRDSLDFDP